MAYANILMNDLVARLVKHYSYTNWFVIAAFLHLAVIPLLMWGVLRRKAEMPSQTLDFAL